MQISCFAASNIALHRLTNQSSSYNISYNNGYAIAFQSALAVDGISKANVSIGQCAITGVDFEPWWTVDLGLEISVDWLNITTTAGSLLSLAFALTL